MIASCSQPITRSVTLISTTLVARCETPMGPLCTLATTSSSPLLSLTQPMVALATGTRGPSDVCTAILQISPTRNCYRVCDCAHKSEQVKVTALRGHRIYVRERFVGAQC
ncbi:hypothetical protein BDY19DRAFT_971707 [Irpex rosettiformis]|uniref:Uncharacterized protein n=1 Tax=Irpex rosettiformis TaxID=378272 RepID=A0ACB8TQY6_9APHY|nr:hypothetical protein BDY19DRAFT_971707 [Irpex rosettiformis]